MREGELRSGDVVEVKSAAEILDTLDDSGQLEALPFMPEMLQHSGRRFVVSKRADKVCDTIHYTGSRKIPDAVFLEDLRCDGKAHGGCEAECRLVWKERWLRRVEADSAPPAPAGPLSDALAKRLTSHCTAMADIGGKPQQVFRCQATELQRSSRHLRTFDPRPYFRELGTGNVSVGRFLRVIPRAVVTEFLRKLGLFSPMPFAGRRRVSAPPESALGLEPGDWVRVKSKEQIAATLTPAGRNRGLWFDREMVPFCGKVHRVRRRVSRIIDEPSGRMIELKNPCVVLEGVVCSGDLSTTRWFCPREIFSYWRECWLERVTDGTQTSQAGSSDAPRGTTAS